jgi:hypothetical protein
MNGYFEVSDYTLYRNTATTFINVSQRREGAKPEMDKHA